MFGIIRILISGAVFAALVLAIKSQEKMRRHSLYAIALIIAVALNIGFAFFPFENLFITFDSPEKAYEYYNGKSEETFVVEGTVCDFVVAQKGESSSYLMIPKTENGWKIGLGSEMKRVAQNISGDTTLYVYRYKQTNEYFITVHNAYGKAMKITDCYNSVFYALSNDQGESDKPTWSYYAYVPGYNAAYYALVDGNTIMV